MNNVDFRRTSAGGFWGSIGRDSEDVDEGFGFRDVASVDFAVQTFQGVGAVRRGDEGADFGGGLGFVEFADDVVTKKTVRAGDDIDLFHIKPPVDITIAFCHSK